MSNISPAIIFNETKQAWQTVILGFHSHTIKNKNALVQRSPMQLVFTYW